jgi:hypothetical protein
MPLGAFKLNSIAKYFTDASVDPGSAWIVSLGSSVNNASPKARYNGNSLNYLSVMPSSSTSTVEYANFDFDGAVNFKKTLTYSDDGNIAGYSIATTENNTYIARWVPNKIWLSKFQENGDISYRKTVVISGVNNSGIDRTDSDLSIDSDGNLYYCLIDINNNDSCIVSLDSLGGFRWCKSYKISTFRFRIESISSNGSYLWASGTGRTPSSAIDEAWILKINKADGSVVSSSSYRANSNDTFASSIYSTASDAVYFIHRTVANTMHIGKINSSMSMQWTKNLNSGEDANLTSIAYDSENDMLYFSCESQPNNLTLITKMSSDGTFQAHARLSRSSSFTTTTGIDFKYGHLAVALRAWNSTTGGTNKLFRIPEDFSSTGTYQDIVYATVSNLTGTASYTWNTGSITTASKSITLETVSEPTVADSSITITSPTTI